MLTFDAQVLRNAIKQATHVAGTRVWLPILEFAKVDAKSVTHVGSEIAISVKCDGDGEGAVLVPFAAILPIINGVSGQITLSPGMAKWKGGKFGWVAPDASGYPEMVRSAVDLAGKANGKQLAGALAKAAPMVLSEEYEQPFSFSWIDLGAKMVYATNRSVMCAISLDCDSAPNTVPVSKTLAAALLGLNGDCDITIGDRQVGFTTESVQVFATLPEQKFPEFSRVYSQKANSVACDVDLDVLRSAIAAIASLGPSTVVTMADVNGSYIASAKDALDRAVEINVGAACGAKFRANASLFSTALKGATAMHYTAPNKPLFFDGQGFVNLLMPFV